MQLPLFQTIHIKSGTPEELMSLLNPELNLKHPIVFNLKKIPFDQQREVTGLIENFYVTNNYSFKFPYAVYLLSDHESSVSNMTTIYSETELPKFFTNKEGKLNVKETHLMNKNRLLQQEIHNTDAGNANRELAVFGEVHRQIFLMEEERIFYRHILNSLKKEKRS